MLPTDLQYTDNYIVMAAHILVTLYEQTQDNKCLWRAIALLGE